MSIASRFAAAIALIALPASTLLAQNPHAAPQLRFERGISFGLVVPSQRSGVARVTPSGSILCSSGIDCLGGQFAGSLLLTGAKDELVQLTAVAALLTNQNGDSMRIKPAPEASQLVLRPGKNKNRVAIGGELTVGERQPGGAYSGNYEIYAEYQ